MYRTLGIILGTAVISAATLSAQQNPAGPSDSAAAQDVKPVTYIGCLSAGTAADNFVLLNAQQKGQKDKDRIALKVVAATPKVKLEPHVTQEVEITGTLGTPSASGSSSESSTEGAVLRVLKATTVKFRVSSCG
jgi:hypothetical protein